MRFNPASKATTIFGEENTQFVRVCGVDVGEREAINTTLKIPEQCQQCKNLPYCAHIIVAIYGKATQQAWKTRKTACGSNYFEWENKLTKYDFEEIA